MDTDQIVPGRYAPYMRPDADVGEAAFIEARPEFAQNARPGDIIIAASNFGCGSSREYAVTALKRRQVGAIVALSYARIFYRNGINLGIPLYIAPEVVQGVPDGAEVELDLVNQTLVANGKTYALPPMPKFAQEIISAGGVVPYVKTHGRFPGE